MKALTLWQPWATLIAIGVKTIETRSWRAPAALIGERIAIHAAAREPVRGEDVGEWYPECDLGEWIMVGGITQPGWQQHPMPLGAVVATARLVECLPMLGPGSDSIGPHLFVSPLPALYVCPDKGGDPAIGVRLVTEQQPYGDFRPGRWAWMLDDIEPLPEPVPARGGQRIWNWAVPT